MLRRGRTVALGSFTVTGGAIVVTDPCYEPNTWCVSAPKAAGDGAWDAEAELSAREQRVSVLRAIGPGFHSAKPWVRANFRVGVDSGQAGVFTAHTYRGGSDAAFYEACCEATCSDKGGGVVEGGCVSSTGFGDGVYGAKLRLDDSGRVCGVQITFMDR